MSDKHFEEGERSRGVVDTVKNSIYIIIGVIAIVQGYLTFHDSMLLLKKDVEILQESHKEHLEEGSGQTALMNQKIEDLEVMMEDLEYRIQNHGHRHEPNNQY